MLLINALKHVDKSEMCLLSPNKMRSSLRPGGAHLFIHQVLIHVQSINTTRNEMKLFSLIFLLSLAKAQIVTEKPPIEDKATVFLESKAETCFYISTEEGHELDVEFWVLSSDPNNARTDKIVATIGDPYNKLIWYQYKKSEKALKNHKIAHKGEYKLCFKNPNSKWVKIAWGFTLHGSVDYTKLNELMREEWAEQATNASKALRLSLIKLQANAHRMSRLTWTIKTFLTKETGFVKAAGEMIDTWSVVHTALLMAIGVGQVTFLKRLFVSSRGSQNFSARA